MKKIRITESELINMIEKLVKENMGFANLGMGKPTDKYKDLNLDEGDDTEGEVEKVENQTWEETQENLKMAEKNFGKDSPAYKNQLSILKKFKVQGETTEGVDTVNVDVASGSDDEDAWMESVDESRIIDLVKTRLNEFNSGGFENMGFSKPTDKYADLLDVEDEDETFDFTDTFGNGAGAPAPTKNPTIAPSKPGEKKRRGPFQKPKTKPNPKARGKFSVTEKLRKRIGPKKGK